MPVALGILLIAFGADSPVATAATRASPGAPPSPAAGAPSLVVRAPRAPHNATPSSPADATAMPAAWRPSGVSAAKTAASTVTTSGAVPRAIGYIWPKSPRWKERMSRT